MDGGHNILSEWFTANEMLYQLMFDFRWRLISDVVGGYYEVLLVILTGFIIHFIPEKIKNYYRNYFANLHVGFQILTSLLVVFLIYQIASTSLQPFIYFQF